MAKNSDKDKRMAAELKRRGVERKTGRCPNCYKIVANGTSHTNTCKGK
jgi:hypothetical protein